MRQPRVSIFDLGNCVVRVPHEHSPARTPIGLASKKRKPRPFYTSSPTSVNERVLNVFFRFRFLLYFTKGSRTGWGSRPKVVTRVFVRTIGKVVRTQLKEVESCLSRVVSFVALVEVQNTPGSEYGKPLGEPFTFVLMFTWWSIFSRINKTSFSFLFSMT